MAEPAAPSSVPNNNTTSTTTTTASTAAPTTGATPAAGAATATATTSTAGPASASKDNTTAQSTANSAQSTNGSADQSATNRGLPYYEKLRRDLRDTLQKKRLMDKSMAQLEDQIFRFEQSYLEETTAGNIIKGFDNYIKGSSSGSVGAGSLALQGIGGGGGAGRRKAQVTDADRVFSRSSASFMRDSTPSSVQTTPSHAPTPTSGYSGSATKPNGDVSASGSVKGVASSSSSKNKKKSSGTKQEKNDDDEDTDNKPPAKRLKISYGRD